MTLTKQDAADVQAAITTLRRVLGPDVMILALQEEEAIEHLAGLQTAHRLVAVTGPDYLRLLATLSLACGEFQGLSGAALCLENRLRDILAGVDEAT